MAKIEIYGIDDIMDDNLYCILLFDENLIKEHSELVLQVLSELFTSCINVLVKKASW